MTIKELGDYIVENCDFKNNKNDDGYLPFKNKMILKKALPIYIEKNNEIQIVYVVAIDLTYENSNRPFNFFTGKENLWFNHFDYKIISLAKNILKAIK